LHQCGRESVPAFLGGDGEGNTLKEGAEEMYRQPDGRLLRKPRYSREICRTHADHLGLRPAAANLDPVVIELREGNIFALEEAYVVEQLAGRQE
jgi:hypothetical protein